MKPRPKSRSYDDDLSAVDTMRKGQSVRSGLFQRSDGAADDEEASRDDDLPLLESMQELLNREKLVLEFKLVEKDDAISQLQEKLKLLEVELKNQQVKHGEVPRSGRPRQLWTPPPVKPKPPVFSNRCMDLSSRGLDRRRLELVAKQYKALKKPVDVMLLSGNPDLDDSCVDLLTELISANKTGLRRLDLSSNGLGPSAAAAVLQLLKPGGTLASKLEVLQLDNNRGMAQVPGLGSDVARVMKEATEKKSLSRLFWLTVTLDDFRTLAGEGGVGSGVGTGKKRPASALASGGKKAQEVKKQDKHTPVGHGGGHGGRDPFNALAFAGGWKLKERPPIRALEVKHARLSIKTVQALVVPQALKSLTHLDLTNAMIGAMGAQCIADALKGSADKEVSLMHLGLRGNLIADYGTRVVADCLRSPSNTLTSLDLRSNLIGEPGGLALARALRHNDTVAALWLGYNRFGTAVVAKLVNLAEKPNSPLVIVDLEGQAGAVVQRTQLEDQLKVNARASCSGGAPDGMIDVLSWRKEHVHSQPFSAAGSDGYLRVFVAELPDSAFEIRDVNFVDEGSTHKSASGCTERSVITVHMSWRARRAGSKLGKSRFLWKIVRERAGETRTMQEGIGGARIVPPAQIRQPSSSAANTDRPFEEFIVGLPGFEPGDRVMLKVAPCDRQRDVVVRSALDEAGEVQCQDVRVWTQLDRDYGLLYESEGLALKDEVAAVAESYGAWALNKGEEERREALKLLLQLAAGQYWCMHEVFVGSGPDVDLIWEARIEDDDGGVPLPFVWAVIRRSLGESAVVADGSDDADVGHEWVRSEVTVTDCISGDVLVLWLGVKGRKGSPAATFGSSDVSHRTKQVCSLRPMFRNLKLYLRAGDAMTRRPPYAAADPYEVIRHNAAWG